MISPVDHRVFPAIVADVGFPRVVYGDMVIEGHAGWRDALARASRADRPRLLRLLETDLMKATSYGIERLRRFGPFEGTKADLPELESRIELYGDPQALPLIVGALRRLPGPVRESVLAEVTFISVGFWSAAWTGSALRRDSDGQTRFSEIVLSGQASVRVVLHEMAHHWHSNTRRDEPHTRPAVSAAEEEGWKRMEANGDISGWTSAIDRHERLADSLAWLWLEREP